MRQEGQPKKKITTADLPDEMTAEEYLQWLRNTPAGNAAPASDETVRRNKRNSRVGAAGEDTATITLRQLGVNRVTPVGKNVKLSPYTNPSGQRPMRGQKAAPVYYVTFAEKLAGDLTGLYGANGRMVLAEVKTHDDDRLQFSKLRDQQPESLTNHHECGGISLLVWVHPVGNLVMRWPIPGFKCRTSIPLEWAIDNQWTGEQTAESQEPRPPIKGRGN